MQDFEVEAAFDLGLLATARGWHRRLALAAERVVLKSFARVSTISHRMEKRLRVKGVADERIVSFPNWVDTAEIHPLEGPNPYRDELALSPDSVVALYAGNFGEKQGVETLLDVARRLRDGDAMERRIVIVLCGDGAARHDIHRLAERLENVRVLPLQPKERFNQLLNLADIHLLPQRVGAADLVMPSKLGGMLASGRPVVAAAAAGTQVADEVVGRGIVVPPEDAAAMAAAVSRLARDPVERARLGAAARAYAVEAWDRERILLRFESQLEALRR
jgi:colanic acid biosynthesis glycosyl transferase WcaI